jgi:hypothetical protein
LKNFQTIKKLKWKYNLIIDTTARKGFLIRKFIWWKIITPIWHKEIWSLLPRGWILERLNLDYNVKFSISRLNSKKILFFFWWKEPNKLDLKTNLNFLKEFEKFWFKVDILTDNQNQNFNLKNKTYKLKLKDTFYVWHQKFKNFLKSYSLFVWPDWGVFHYATQFIPWLGIYTATNLFAIDKIIFLEAIWNRKIFKSQTKNNLYISQNLHCVWCFQIWCMLKNCWKILDNEIQIIIKKIINYHNQP